MLVPFQKRASLAEADSRHDFPVIARQLHWRATFFTHGRQRLQVPQQHLLHLAYPANYLAVDY